jgi:transaldolase
MSKLIQLAESGQSIWFDYIQRNLITSGELDALINNGLRGITSNPTIFDKAISGSADYDEEIKKYVTKGLTVDEIYEKLALADISLAAAKLLKVYKDTDGLDGYVSIEVNPHLAYKTEETIKQAKRLFSTLNRPNIMIKVPATREGLPAVTELIASGINVNVTLIFSKENYKDVAEAYILGVEKLNSKGGDLSKVASVASFFVSRVDTATDKILDSLNKKELKGKAAIANSKLSYELFNEIYSSERWNSLKAKGARVQRLLWASTGTKNPEYKDTLYVDELIGSPTVNTIPPATLNAFIDHGVIDSTLERGIEDAKTVFNELEKLGVNIPDITEKLQVDGVKSFNDSFDSLMNSLAEKVKKISE